MSNIRWMLLVGRALPSVEVSEDWVRSPTADVYVGPWPIVVIDEERPVIRLDPEPDRRPRPRRDWEQRERRKRR